VLKIQEFRERVRASDSVAGVQRALEETFNDLGFEQLSYVVLRAPHGAQRPKILSTFPKDWRSRYVDANYSHFDAVYPAASAFLFPLRWDELYSDFRTTRKQKLIFDEAKEFGIKQGVTVPIHGPAGGLASLSVSGAMSARNFESVWENHYDELTLIAAHAHEAMLRRSLGDESYEPIRLTDREREALTWTSRGKTAWEIAQLLSVSENTVQFHLKRCMRKLQVFSKHHAVVKAIMLGLVVPDL
jgi:LuxR family transcriptional activator of conjugal transfer of Ti plasmids